MNSRLHLNPFACIILAGMTGLSASVCAQSTSQSSPTLMQLVPVTITYTWNSNGTARIYSAQPGGAQASGYEGTSSQSVNSANYQAFDIPAATTISGSQSSVSSCNPAQGACSYIAQAIWSATVTTALNGAVSLGNIQSTTTLSANASGSATPYSLSMNISAVPGGYFGLVILPGTYAANQTFYVPFPGVPILTNSGIQTVWGTITLGKETAITDANGNVTGTAVNALEFDGTLVPSGSTIQWPAGQAMIIGVAPNKVTLSYRFNAGL